MLYCGITLMGRQPVTLTHHCESHDSYRKLAGVGASMRMEAFVPSRFGS